jgi:serine O-acetyltransferase
MFKTLNLIRTDLREKARWLYGADSRAEVIKALMTDGSGAMVCYRAMQAARRHNSPVLEMFFNKVNSSVNNCIIGRGADFGPGFVLIHATGVVINGEVRGGARVFLEHQVTMGAERGDSPELGDDIFVGAGAKVVGSVHIGSGAKVGANAVVVHDVDPDTTVVGIPAKPVRSKSADAKPVRPD